jgi:hypothetical protein
MLASNPNAPDMHDSIPADEPPAYSPTPQSMPPTEPSPTSNTTAITLPKPIVIPSTSTSLPNFPIAYPQNLTGFIPQPQFEAFLTTINKAAKAPAAFEIVQHTSGILSLVPEPTLQTVAGVTELVGEAGAESYSFVQVRKAMKVANATIFKPRGLKAKLVEFKDIVLETGMLKMEEGGKVPAGDRVLRHPLGENDGKEEDRVVSTAERIIWALAPYAEELEVDVGTTDASTDEATEPHQPPSRTKKMKDGLKSVDGKIDAWERREKEKSLLRYRAEAREKLKKMVEKEAERHQKEMQEIEKEEIKRKTKLEKEGNKNRQKREKEEAKNIEKLAAKEAKRKGKQDIRSSIEGTAAKLSLDDQRDSVSAESGYSQDEADVNQSRVERMERAQAKHEKRVQEIEIASVKEDKEEKAVRKISFLLITNAKDKKPPTSLAGVARYYISGKVAREDKMDRQSS